MSAVSGAGAGVGAGAVVSAAAAAASASVGAVDLVHLADERGNRCVVRVTGPSRPGSHNLRADVLVSASWVDARLDVYLFPGDLDLWQAALLELGPGREARIGHDRGLNLVLHMIEDRSLAVTVHDPDRLTTALGMRPEEDWIEDHCRRAEEVRRVWPRIC
ncbi:hypothetical protein SAMN05428944_3080 [Streptomyces sp. 1222.5]|nr:hypothetical protein BX260_5011 [Streptomyces sp. 5112.2]SEC25847.1 hypothetical protein SAMN05428944_3080 [Streptomyces sp. 1222.5]